MDDKKIYANSYIDKIYEMLGRIFKEALKRDYILKNPLLNVEKTKLIKDHKKLKHLIYKNNKPF